MSDPQTAMPPKQRPRLMRVDLVRGIALIGVMVFHLCWDLRYFEFVLWPMDTDWRWIAFQKTLVASFVGISGLSLWLAHGAGINWRGFWRRWGMLFGAALVITLATWFTFQPAFVYFGILHALALFALLGLLFLRLPVWALIATGLVIVGAGIGFSDPVFNAKPLSWIGFWTVPPYTNDLVPILPWFGVFLVGMGLAPVLTRSDGWLAGKTDWGWFGTALRWIGRHSLILYLVHQPLLLGVLVPLESVLQPQNWHRAERFVGECEASCTLGTTESAYCTAYCACSLEQIEAGDLWDAVSAFSPDAEQRAEIDSMIALCTAMGRSAAE